VHTARIWKDAAAELPPLRSGNAYLSQARVLPNVQIEGSTNMAKQIIGTIQFIAQHKELRP
jgi:hypothetical protein